MRSLAFIVILAIVLAYIAECQAASSTSNIHYKDMPVSPPSVPSMGTSGAYSDICVVVRAGGISGGWFGISAGVHIEDKNCQRIKLSRALAQLGMKISATAMLCQDPRVFKSMIAAGSPCPINGKIGDEAIQEYRKRGILDEDNNVIKNHMVTPVEFDADESVGRRNYYGQPTQ